MLKTALSRLRDHMAEKDYRAALKLAAGWADLGAHRNAIKDGWLAHTHPDLLLEMGKDPEALKTAGVAALRERYKIDPA